MILFIIIIIIIILCDVRLYTLGVCYSGLLVGLLRLACRGETITRKCATPGLPGEHIIPTLADLLLLSHSTNTD